MRFTIIPVRCAGTVKEDCNKLIGFKLGHGTTGTSHGLCKKHYKYYMDQIEKEKHTVEIYCPRCKEETECERDELFAACQCGTEFEIYNGLWITMEMAEWIRSQKVRGVCNKYLKKFQEA